jgi:hypothetical protein
MTASEGLTLLRQPFAPNLIGKLPRVTCRACSENRGVCDKHTKSKCQVCDQWISNQHIHLDFVGHAALTSRFLDADPEWSWEPLAVGENGLPLFDQLGGLWIKLTICGVTRLGYGDAQGKTGPNAIKEAIGDALRNAGMRFGAALDLWHKGDLHADEQHPALDPEHRQAPPSREKAQRTKASRTSDAPAIDPSTDPFAAPITDRVWLADWSATVTRAPDGAALAEAWKVLGAKVKAGEVDEADRAAAEELWKARAAEVGQQQNPAPAEGEWPPVATPGSGEAA